MPVDAKYGPMVEVKANADFATQSARPSRPPSRPAEFSKDVVARSVSKHRRARARAPQHHDDRASSRRTTRTASTTRPAPATSAACYQWIDKVLQAQVYNYGKRLLFDVTCPSPRPRTSCAGARWPISRWQHREAAPVHAGCEPDHRGQLPHLRAALRGVRHRAAAAVHQDRLQGVRRCSPPRPPRVEQVRAHRHRRRLPGQVRAVPAQLHGLANPG